MCEIAQFQKKKTTGYIEGGGYNGFKEMYRHGCQFINFVKIILLPPYIPSEKEKENPRLYAENVRQIIANQLNYQCTPHSLGDWAMLAEAIATDTMLETHR